MFVLFSLKLSHIFGRSRWNGRMQGNLRWRKSVEMVLTTSWIAWCTCLSMPMSWQWGEASIQVHITSALAFQCLCYPSAYNKCTLQVKPGTAFQLSKTPQRSLNMWSRIPRRCWVPKKRPKNGENFRPTAYSPPSWAAPVLQFWFLFCPTTSRRCTVLSAKTCHKVQLNLSAIISAIPNMAFRERRRHTKIFQICRHGFHPTLSNLFIIGTGACINSQKSSFLKKKQIFRIWDFKCASISWFQAVSQSVTYRFSNIQ